MLSDQERRNDEIFAIENICNPNQFRYHKKESITECFFSISCDLANKNIMIGYTSTIRSSIQYLPPVRFYVQLPNNYPSKSPPKFNIAVNWLTPWEISLSCQKLDELWQENEFNEILFVWFSFLKYDLLSFLQIKDILHVSYLMDLHKNPDDELLLELLNFKDERVVYGGLFLNPIERLKDYNESQNLLEFESQIHECDICFCANAGTMCIKINECSHTFCKDCILQYLTIRINERNVKCIQCPYADCRAKIKSDQIRNICSTEVYKKYTKYLVQNLSLDIQNMRLICCPRRSCRTDVYIEVGESLASCPTCNYNFCAYCFKVYHGVSACTMESEEKLKLIKEYERANAEGKRFLEKKYGRQQIQQIVEKQLTDEYLQQNTKHCPTCTALTAKLTGCNLMTCAHCHTHFCWLCNSKIESDDKYNYEHFTSRANGSCSGRLFEPVNGQIDDFDPETANGYDIVPNWDLNMFLKMIRH